ncbi:MAG: hypothetical protein Q8Q32_01795 [bacterium]|nr:hypothetical protein [bacterium]
MTNKKSFAIATFLAIAVLALSAATVFAGHNGAMVSHETFSCGETTFTATITDPDGTHKVTNMYLVVSADGNTQSVIIPTDGSDAEITVGPFTEDMTIYWNVFGGGERDYDQPLWNGYGEEGFSADIAAYADDQGGYGWVLDGPEEENPFVNWNTIEVEGCPDDDPEPPTVDNPETKADCKNGGWEAMGFRNQGQCIRYVNTDQDSR